MTKYDEVVVRVDTVEEYRAVLDKWFDKGYDWITSLCSQDYHEGYFHGGGRYLILEADRRISSSSGQYVRDENLKVTPFKEFMAKEQGVTPWVPAPEDIPEQEHGKVTYEVSEEQMKFIKEAKENQYPASYLMVHDDEYVNMFSDVEYGTTFERDLLKYLSGDESVVFQLKDPLFMLKGKDTDGDAVYFTVDPYRLAPTYTYDKSYAFTAPHEEITRWDNPFWEIEPVEA